MLEKHILHFYYIWLFYALFVNLIAFSSSERRSCNRILMEDLNEGIITHINYPFNYTEQLNCRISIRVPNYLSSMRPTLCFTFHRFSMPYSDGCFNDHLSMGDLGRFCGRGTLNGLPSKIDDPLTNLFDDKFCVNVVAYENYEITYQTIMNSSDLGFYATFQFKDSDEDEPILIDDKTSMAPCLGDTQFMCFNRRCIEKNQACDSKDDCGDNSDESLTHANCQNTHGFELCNFEKDMCQFNQSGWYYGQSALPMPTYDSTLRNNEGFFVYTDASQFSTSLTYTKYPIFPAIKSEIYCLSFWFYMDRYVGRLVLYIRGQNLERTAVMIKDDAQGTQWFQSEVEIDKKYFPLTEISFEVDKSLKTNIHDNVAIDDISLQPGQCFNNDATCMFELGFCGWRAFISAELKYSARWERHNGADPNPNTGPLTDRFAKNGYYLLMDSSKYNALDKARVVSQPISLTSGSGTVCLEFWYLIYGSNMGELNVYMLDSRKKLKSLWSDPGRNVRNWMYAFVHISTDGAFQLMFEGVRGISARSDLAIDDISVTPGYCQSKQANTNAPGIRPTLNPYFPPYPGHSGQNITTCGSDQFRCFSGDQCISRYEVCDRMPQCFDRSDESGCPQTGGPLYYHNPPQMNLGSIVGISLASVGILVITFSLLFFFLTRRRMLRHHRAYQLSTFAPELLSHNFDGIMFTGVPKPPPYQDVTDASGTPSMPPPYSEQPPPPYLLTGAEGDAQSTI